MPRTQPKFVSSSEKNEILNDFWSAIFYLDTKEEVKNFFKNLLSETESLMLARRIRIAKLLLQNESYDSIKESLKTSDSTIANVHHWLQDGTDNHIKIIQKLKKELARHPKYRESKYPEPFSFEWLKKRYPLHFLLFNLFDSFTKENIERK